MHEVSIAESIVRTVGEVVGTARVEAVSITVGALSGVVPDALEFAWDVATTGTTLGGSRLEIERVPATVYCAGCSLLVEPEIGFLCPRCGRLSGDLRSGRELEIRSVRVIDEVEVGGR